MRRWRYWIEARHDRAETHHEDLAAAKAVARELRAEGYGPVAVLQRGARKVVWTTDEGGSTEGAR